MRWPVGCHPQAKKILLYVAREKIAIEEGRWYGQLATPGTSSRTTCTTGLACREPLLKRGLTFSGRLAGQEAFDANVLVEFVSVDAVPSAN